MLNKKTVADLPDSVVRGRRALVRVDFNVPMEGTVVADDTRIRASLPTIELLRKRGASVVLLSHLGRPDGKPTPKYSLEPVSRRLAELISGNVSFIESTDSDEALKESTELQPGDVVLLENTRFLGGE